jgi:hypothetical protein
MSEAELRARFLAAGRAFLRDPSEAALEALLSRYSLYHVAHHGSERPRRRAHQIEWNARNISADCPKCPRPTHGGEYDGAFILPSLSLGAITCRSFLKNQVDGRR